MRKKEDQVLIILSVGTVISILFIIRECSYSLVWDTAIMRWLFVSKNNEKLMSNIAFSYIAAYMFYIMQVYIPKLLNRKNAIAVLRPKIREFIFKVYELSFVLRQVSYQQGEGVYVNTEYFPVYYKYRLNNMSYLKKVTNSNTLLVLQRQIEELYSTLLNRLVIYNLDVSILELWEQIPIEYYREIIQMIKMNENSKASVLIKGVEEDSEVMRCIEKIFGVKANIVFEKVDQDVPIDAYEQLVRRSVLMEPELVLQLDK